MSTSRKDKVTLNEQIELFNGGFKVGGWQNRPMFFECIKNLTYVYAEGFGDSRARWKQRLL
jgi:hypothetical protein